MPDSLVFAAAQAGEPSALDRLLRAAARHTPLCPPPVPPRYGHRRRGAEALIVVYRRVGNVRDAAALAGWIFRVVARMKQSKPGE